MKVVICGSWFIRKLDYVSQAVEEAMLLPGFQEVTEVISGGANGVDKLGERWAKLHKVDIVIFEANWEKYGRSAGIKRNLKMLERAEAVIAVGVSSGTAHTIEVARERGLPLHVKVV